MSCGSMTVGTWAISPQPTTLPMLPPAVRRVDAVLDVAIEIERPGAAFATDAGLAVAAEGLAQVAHEEAVVPHQTGRDLRRHALGPLRIAGHHHGGEAVVGVVGERDGLIFGAEALQAEHRAEHLLAQDLA